MIKITSNKSAKLTKMVRNFYLKKRMWRYLWVPKNFPVILPEKWWWKWWFGGASKRVWRSEEKLPDGEMKKKKGAGQREKRELKKEWWVVGLGGAWHVGTQNKYLILHFFFFFKKKLTGCYMSTYNINCLWWKEF